MLKKKGNKKEGYTIIRTFNEGHSKITRPIMTTIDDKQQILTFTELELLSEEVALGKIQDESFIIYEVDNGASYKVLHSVMEFHGLKSYETFFGGVELKSKEYVIFRKMEGCPLEKLKCRVRHNQFITGKDIMLFTCRGKLKMLNFDCDKLKMFGSLALLRGSFSGIKSNWVLNTTDGTLYKTTFSFKFDDVISVDIREPYILLETANMKAFAYMNCNDTFDATGTYVVEFRGDYRFKEYYLNDSSEKRGVIYDDAEERFLFLEGNVFTKGAMLNINKNRYVLNDEFELKPITTEILTDANNTLIQRYSLDVDIKKDNYIIRDGEMQTKNGEKFKAQIINSNIFDDVSKQEDCNAEFLLNDYLLQQYQIGFARKELTENFSTPISHIVRAQNGLSEHEREYTFKTVYPRVFKNFLVFEELCLQKTIIVDLRKKDIARKTEMEFVMPTKNFLIGVKDTFLHLEAKGLHIRCDFLKFAPEGMMLMGYDTTGYYAFIIKDNGSISEISVKKFLTTDYYAIYDVVTWKNAYAKSLPSLFEERKNLEKMQVF